MRSARPILAKFPKITRTITGTINPKLYSQSHDYLYKLPIQLYRTTSNNSTRTI